MMDFELRLPHFAVRSRRMTALAGLAAAGLAVLLAGCGGDNNNSNTRATNVVYTESNEPAANTILAFRRASDGTLTPLTGSPFSLNGQGLANPQENFGPADKDTPIITSPDHRLMFAVNPGSNTIAVLNINADGSLTHVAGSPFPSGGVNPSSLALVGSHLYVANKNVASGNGGAGTPTYTAFNVAANGALTQITSVNITAPAGASAAQVVASPDGKTLFTNDFFGPISNPAQGSLRSWHINADGTLTQVGTALTVPNTVPNGTPAQLQGLYFVTQGVQVHPTQRIFYALAPVSSTLFAYTYDANGALTFNSQVKTTGLLSCWILFNKNASRMYIVSTGDNSVSVMNTSNPLAPVEIQHLVLKDAGPNFQVLPIIPNVFSSTGAEEALDPSGQHLYVVSHRNNPDQTYQGGNFLHVLNVAADGTLTEPGNSVNLNLTNAAHAQGVLAF